MVKAHEVLGSSTGSYLAAASRAADTLWERGLLRKGVGLCHGIAGNGYAFLSLVGGCRCRCRRTAALTSA
jgi:hypothetical protein